MGQANCHACQERLEFVLDAADMLIASGVEHDEQVRQVIIDGHTLHFRLPNSLDLAAIARCRDVASARNLLLQRCILHIEQDGTETTIEAMPETIITTLAAQMAEHDPQAEMLLELSCPACNHNWSMLFDIVVFLWNEVCAQAKRLLREVHTLAQAYGWREADILSLSPARRQFYLEMVS